MKTRIIIFTVTLPVLALAGWTALGAEGLAPASNSAENRAGRGVQNQGEASNGRLERAEARVRDRLGIASCMAIELEDGVDPVERLQADGFIIEATLEEVEAALDAARQTPEKSDDIAAMRMLHRGSYRFYCDSE